MSPSKILIVCFDNIGDLIFSSALLPPLRRQFPAARLGVWCKEYTAALAPLMPHVDAVYASDPFWDRSPGHGKGSMRRFARTTMAVRKARYDCALIPSLRWQAAAAALAAHIPVRIGMAGRRNRRWLTVCLPPRDRSQPVMTDIARLLEPLGIHAGPLSYALGRDRLPHQPAVQVAERQIVLHPFASSTARCVPHDVWLSFAAELRRTGWRVTWFGTKAELMSLARVRIVTEHDSFPGFEDDLSAAAAIIAAADVFVGHDSGPMHMASALGIPTIGVFAPGEPLRTFPQGAAPYVLVTASHPHAIGPHDLLNALAHLNRELSDTASHT